MVFLKNALMCIKKVKLINHDCLPILMLLYIMLYIMHIKAPIIFNLLLVAITLVSLRDLKSDCVRIEYRLDGGLFNLQRLQAKTKNSYAMISALQYADDAAFPSLTGDGLQRGLAVMSETYLCAGLIINTTKT